MKIPAPEPDASQPRPMTGGHVPLPLLPVAEAVPRLSTALSNAGCAVLAAPPGSGKTTLVPLMLLDEDWLGGRKILMLEPRRVAARASAARMASLIGERVGERIGYQIRFERKVSSATRIEVITEGLLTRRLQADAELPDVGLIVFDEFHERSLEADLALALTLDARANLRPDLRVLVMSATLDTLRVATLLGDAPVIESGGRLFPVDVRYAPPRAGVEPADAVASAVLAALDERAGDVLVFLPGAREIRDAQWRLEPRLPAAGGVELHPLYGDLSSAAQDAALKLAAPGCRKIILATNIAQTSLTIEGVATVIDCGLARVARFDLGAGANRLDTVRVSRASADQRAGRAGRLGPGVAIRLWSRDQQGQLPAHDFPEILSADLSRFALEMAIWGATEISRMKLLDPPPSANWSYARELLQGLNAIDEAGRITSHGRELARLPTAPRIAHMLLSAHALNLVDTAAWTAAILDERETQADLGFEVARFRSGRATDPHALRRARDAVRQLLRLIGASDADAAGSREKFEESGVDDAESVGRVLALAFPERIARRREQQRDARDVHYLCVDGGEAQVSAREPLAAAEWLAVAHWSPGTPRRIRSAARISEKDVLHDHAGHIRNSLDIAWDSQTESVRAEQQQRLGALVLERRSPRDLPQEALRAAMLQGIRSLGLQVLPWTDSARQWQARVESLRAWRPEEAWPEVADTALEVDLQTWLAPHLDGISRREQLARLDLASILEAGLDYAQQQRLAHLAPTHLQVPSGSRITLEYLANGAAPILAVKLQELFGLKQTPTVNDGRSRVSLHLLSPGRRPIQVTQDLAGFWSRTYAEVKKELKGRYPKHPWPDDPLAAPPTARAKPRGT